MRYRTDRCDSLPFRAPCSVRASHEYPPRQFRPDPREPHIAIAESNQSRSRRYLSLGHCTRKGFGSTGRVATLLLRFGPVGALATGPEGGQPRALSATCRVDARWLHFGAFTNRQSGLQALTLRPCADVGWLTGHFSRHDPRQERSSAFFELPSRSYS